MNNWLIAARAFTRRKRLMVAAIFVLAWGFAGLVAIFTVGNVLLFHGLPWRDANRIVVIKEDRGTSQPLTELAPANFADLEGSTHILGNWAAWVGLSRTVRGGLFPEPVRGVACSASLFSLFGIDPTMGRVFGTEEADAVLISDTLWHRQFRADPAILGHPINLDGRAYNVVGIVPEALGYPQGIDIWLPLSSVKPLLHLRQLPIFFTLARMSRGADTVAAQRELDQVASWLRTSYSVDHNVHFAVLPFRRVFIGDTRPLLGLLTAAAAFLLFVACANVMAILLAASLDRRHEIALQLALGADAKRLRAQFAREGFLLSSVAGACGLLITPLLLHFLGSMIPRQVTISGGLRIDWTSIMFACCISICTGFTFTAVPLALHSRLKDFAEILQTSAMRHTGGRRAGASWSLMIASEVAVTVALCVGSGLLIRSLIDVTTTNLGYDPQGVVAARVSLAGPEYSDDGRKIATVEALLRQLKGIAGAESAGLITFVPLGGAAAQYSIQIAGDSVHAADQLTSASVEVVGGDYFRTLKIPLIRGRIFEASDSATAPRVCVVNQSFRDRYFNSRYAVGETIAVGQGDDRYRIVGIVGDTRETLATPASPSVYLAYQQAPWSAFDLVLRGSGQVNALIPTVRKVISSNNPDLPIVRIETLEGFRNELLIDRRLRTLFAALYACICLVLMTIGLYAVVAYSIRARRREIAMRIALGANPAAIFRRVIYQGAMPVVFGIAIGLAASNPLGKLIAGLLYGVKPTDGTTFIAVSAFVLSLCVATICIPAREASRADIAEMLRNE